VIYSFFSGVSFLTGPFQNGSPERSPALSEEAPAKGYPMRLLQHSVRCNDNDKAVLSPRTKRIPFFERGYKDTFFTDFMQAIFDLFRETSSGEREA